MHLVRVNELAPPSAGYLGHVAQSQHQNQQLSRLLSYRGQMPVARTPVGPHAVTINDGGSEVMFVCGANGGMVDGRLGTFPAAATQLKVADGIRCADMVDHNIVHQSPTRTTMIKKSPSGRSEDLARSAMDRALPTGKMIKGQVNRCYFSVSSADKIVGFDYYLFICVDRRLKESKKEALRPIMSVYFISKVGCMKSQSCFICLFDHRIYIGLHFCQLTLTLLLQNDLFEKCPKTTPNIATM